MTGHDCAHENAVLRLALLRRWPDGADAELRAHAECCPVCADVLAVAAMLQRDREESLQHAQLPAAGQVWWRAALRAHAESAEAARRPMVWLQGIAAACAIGLIAALLTVAWPSIYEAVSATAAGLRPDVAPLVEVLRPILPIAIMLLACVIVTPIVVYFALSDE